MKRGWISRSALLALGLVLIVALTLMAGCGKKSKVETDPTTTAAAPDTTQTIPEPVKPETEVEAPTGPDYVNLAPEDYGVGDVFFDFDQYDLDDEAMSVLSRDARILKEANVTLLISGHCDERGTVEYNLALGEKRARAVRDYLVSLGVPAGNLRVTSYGESKPFVMGNDEYAWAQNRRAHFERP